MMSNVIKKIKLGSIKSTLIDIISFYIEPFELMINPSKKKNKKANKEVIYIPKSKVKRSGVIKQLLDYYKGKKRIMLVLEIFISSFIGFGIIAEYPLFAWFGAYIVSIGVYTSLYSGLYYVFQRKRDVVDGFSRFVQEYIIVRDLTTFKNFVKETKVSEYPIGFRDQVIEMQESLNTKESSVVLKEFFENPINDYQELQINKNLAISAITSQDDAITNALSDQLEFSKKSRSIMEAKLSFLQVFIYLVLGFMFGIQAVLVFQFKSILGTGSGILANIIITPSSLAYFFFLVFGGLSVVFLSIGTYFAMYKEGRGIKAGLIMLYIVFVISFIIFFTQL